MSQTPLGRQNELMRLKKKEKKKREKTEERTEKNGDK